VGVAEEQRGLDLSLKWRCWRSHRGSSSSGTPRGFPARGAARLRVDGRWSRFSVKSPPRSSGHPRGRGSAESPSSTIHPHTQKLAEAAPRAWGNSGSKGLGEQREPAMFSAAGNGAPKTGDAPVGRTCRAGRRPIRRHWPRLLFLGQSQSGY
jgi:hypothetical protein